MLSYLVSGGPVSFGLWQCGAREPGWCEGERLVSAEVVIPLCGGWVQEGSAGRHVATPATAMLGSPGDEYRVRHPVGGGDRCAVFLLEANAFEDLGRAMGCLRGRGPRFRTASMAVPAPIFLSVHRLLSDLGSQRIDSARADFRIAETLDALFEHAVERDGRPGSSDQPTTTQRTAVLLALEFMAASFASRVTLADIAAAARYSPFHFARLFKSITGDTVHQRLTELRLRSALHRIREGDDDLTTVALRSGFSSHSHFSAAFRARFGLAPSLARRKD